MQHPNVDCEVTENINTHPIERHWGISYVQMLKRKYEVKLEHLPRGEGMSEIQKNILF